MIKKYLAYSFFITLFISFSAVAKAPIFVTDKWVFENQENITIIDMSTRQQYQKFHLPNAIWVGFERLIKPQNGLRLSGGKHYMAQILSQIGVTPNDHIVIYDDIGNLSASRLYWELIKLKHPKVSLLDGGIVSWVINGNPVTQTAPTIVPSVYLAPKQSLTDKFTADYSEVLAAIDDPNITIIDTRTEEEFMGSLRQRRSGHIPSAILFPWDISVDFNNQFKKRSSTQLTKILAQLGLEDKTKPIILYCNTANRASRLIPMFQYFGYNNIKLYDGSLQEWARNPNLPLQIGNQP